MKSSLAAVIALVAVGCGGASGLGSSPTEPARTTAGSPANSSGADVLRSWNDGASKRAIVEFVSRVTKEGSPDFVPVPERIATFDNDGTLWAEKPVPFQVFFTFDRVKALAFQHPEWNTKEPFASVLKGDMAGVAAAGEKGIAQLMIATHTGMTTD